MRKLIYLLAFTTSLHAQGIVQLAGFNPYQMVGDTLYFNKNGYDIVRTIKPTFKTSKKGSKQIGEIATYFILTNDHTDKKQMRANTLALIRGIVSNDEYIKLKCSYNFNDYLEAPTKRFEFVTVYGKRCDWIPQLILDTTKLQFEGSYLQYDDNTIDLFYLPKEKRMLDSISTFLDYIENSYYYVDIKQNVQTEVELIPADKCSDYNQLSIPNRTVTDLENFLSAYKWPIFKADSRPVPYRIFRSFSYQDFIRVKLEEELKNGCANSYKLFDQKDSLYALVDSFNQKTILYLAGMKEERVILSSTSRSKIIEFGDDRRIDVNNDGFADIISDTSKFGNVTTISYYPNHQTRNKYNHPWYTSPFTETLKYTFSLGKGYYYLLTCTEDNEYAEIFHFKDNFKKTLTYYRKVFTVKSKHRRRYRRYESNDKKDKKYFYEWYTGGIKSKTYTTHHPEKAIGFKNAAIKQLQNYIDHPEQLEKDFK
jgi:hypothetical protein